MKRFFNNYQRESNDIVITKPVVESNPKNTFSQIKFQPAVDSSAFGPMIQVSDPSYDEIDVQFN